MKLRKNIFWRVVMLLSFSVVMSSILMSFFVIREHRRYAKEVYSAQAVALAERAQRMILWDDRVALRNMLRTVVRETAIVEYAFIELRGKPYVHSFKAGIPAKLLHLHDDRLESPVVTNVHNAEGSMFYNIAVPVAGDVAILHIGLSRDGIDRHTLRDIIAIAVVGAATLLLGFLLSGITAVLTTREVAGLTKSLRQSRDELAMRVEQRTADLNRTNEQLRHEITERKQAEGFIRNILESVGEGFSVIDTEYRIIAANKAYAGQSEMPIDAIVGKPCYEVSHQTHKPCYEAGEKCPVKTALETGKQQSVIHTHRDKKGRPVYVEVKAYPMKDTSGNLTSVIEVTNDISEKIKLEDQLRQAQKMQAIGQLAGGIAHDFNNILTTIIGYGNLLKLKIKEDDPLRSEVDQILGSSEKAAHLTQGLLAFSRQQILHPIPLNLNEIIEKVGKLLLRLIGEDIELKIVLTDKDLTIMADSGHIEQVLMNLATNARDAMPEGGLLTIKTELVELDDKFIRSHGYDIKPGLYALLFVADTGIGMHEEQKKRIFEPFFTTKGVGKGTGLGLSIIYGIVQQHNGHIDIYSEPDKGTVFKVYLPVIKSVIEKEEQKISPPLRRGTETVLLAEDDESVRKLICLVLEQFGYNVIAAVDGEDAVTKFKENSDSIQLILLDVIMPKQSGKEAYEKIKKIRPDIKSIFASGYATDIIDKKGVIEEGVNFIQKPILPDELLRIVRKVLDG